MSKSEFVTDWLELERNFALYKEGDVQATRFAFTSIQAALGTYFRLRIGQRVAAEDLLQTALLKIHFARDRYDSERPLKAWVFTIASRTLIDHWRGGESDPLQQRITDPDGNEEGSALDLVPSQALPIDEKVSLHQDLNKALETLKPTERSIVYLYAVEGLSMAEIADIHGLTESAVKLRAHRAYQELRKLLPLLFAVLWASLFERGN